MFPIGLLQGGVIWGWHDDYYDNDGNYLVDDEDKLFAWYNGYKKWKAQKAKIKEELLPIAWHPDRVMDWCMSEEERCGGSNR